MFFIKLTSKTAKQAHCLLLGASLVDHDTLGDRLLGPVVRVEEAGAGRLGGGALRLDVLGHLHKLGVLALACSGLDGLGLLAANLDVGGSELALLVGRCRTCCRLGALDLQAHSGVYQIHARLQLGTYIFDEQMI